MTERPFTSQQRRMRIKQLPHGSSESPTSDQQKIKKDDDFISTRQNRTILAHLKSGQTLTQPEASQLYGVWRLSARIWDLRNEGYLISTDYVVCGSRRRIGQYKL